MASPVSPYVEAYDGALSIIGTRVGLNSVVVHFEEGRGAEQIMEITSNSWKLPPIRK